jgi:hypothetical protein
MSAKFVSKEHFFREVLVPTGSIAEAVSVLITRVCKPTEDVDAVLWSPLNLVSHYVLNTPDDTDLTALREAVLNHSRRLLGVLAHFAYPVMFPLELLTRELSGTAKALYLLIDAFCAQPDGWTKSLQRQSVPAELRENVNLWRTFSRNIERGDILTKLQLPQMAALVSPLGTEAGREQAQALWDRCFLRTAPAAKTAGASGSDTFPGPALSQHIGVVLLPSGFLEVTAIFDPKRSLSTSAENLANLPEKLTHRLKVQRKVVHCAYTRLTEAVAECEAWLESNRAQTTNLQAEYDHFVESRESATVMDKLKAQFSDEEIAVIRRQMARQD